MYPTYSYQQIMDLYKDGALNGVACRIADEDYHRLKFVSSSLVKDYFKCPGLAATYYEPQAEKSIYRGKPGTQLTALGFGSLFHGLVLEDLPLDMPLNIGDHNKLMTMQENLIAENFVWNEFTSEGEPEVAVFWTHQGMTCKAKFDWINPKLGIADLKTTSEEINDYIEKTFYKWLYDLQGFHYLQGLSAVFPSVPKTMLFTFASKAYPHDSANLLYGADAASKLVDTYQIILAGISDSLETDSWPVYPKEPIEIEGIYR